MNLIRCTECGQDAFKWDMFNTWLRVVHALDFLKLNGDITYELYSSLTDDMMHFKRYALDEDMKNNEAKQWEIAELNALRKELQEKGLNEQAAKIHDVLTSMLD